MIQNYVGFLIKKDKKQIHVIESKVATKKHFLKDDLIVANFISEKLIPLRFLVWLTSLNVDLRDKNVVASDNIEQGFFYIKASSKDVTLQVLVLIFY